MGRFLLQGWKSQPTFTEAVSYIYDSSDWSLKSKPQELKNKPVNNISLCSVGGKVQE